MKARSFSSIWSNVLAIAQRPRLCSNFGNVGSIASQGCALATQTSAVGANALGSSRLPARMAVKSGRAELPAKSGEPHSAQNSRRAVFPLSAARAYCFVTPRVTRSAEVATISDGA
jgi:hypothetical protein